MTADVESEPTGNETLIFRADELIGEYEHVLAGLEEPMGHGTTLESLKGIQQEGLGGRTVEDASDTTISLIDLSQPDGLLGATLFATRGKSDELAIDAEANGLESMVQRYSALNPRVSAESLERQLEAYRQHRAKSAGVPVVLLYEGKGLPLVHNNPAVPSERKCLKAVPSSALRGVMVPAAKRRQVEAMLLPTGIEVLTLETEELMALKRAR
jgi:hypothetical protein